MALQSINPATGENIQNYEETSPAEVQQIIERVHQTYLEWKLSDFAIRSKCMKTVAQILRDESSEYSALMAREMGKPVKVGRGEAEKCAWLCDYYAENAKEFLQPEIIATDASKSFVTFQPIGIILSVMPWNFPFWQVFRFASPALMAGNTVLLKHSSNVSGCGLAIEDIFQRAGFPEHAFRTLLIKSDQVARVIEHPLVKGATLTGSGPAGKAVARQAGDMLKKTVLELGGSDPYVILEDADLEATVATCVSSRLINSGQSCIAAKRFIVVDAIADHFINRFVRLMSSKKMGNPMHEDTDIGPQARHDLRDDLHRQVVQSLEKGAKCLLGGEIPDAAGAFYPPTVLSEVKKGMPAYDEEIFGPVAAIIRVKNEEEAIHVANDSVFGLGAAVFTKDLKRGEKIASTDLEAGCCFVNALVKSDPRLPFGGLKESGYGRELSHYGIKEFVNIKTVYIA